MRIVIESEWPETMIPEALISRNEPGLIAYECSAYSYV